jgi:bifunctional non-homologous end joining protein LigD
LRHTRSGRDISERLPGLAYLADALDRHTAILDGELFVGRGLPQDFYRLSPRLSSKRAVTPVMFGPFDVLEVDGDPLIGKAYTERRSALTMLLDDAEAGAWMRVPSFTEDPVVVFVECVRLGFEGVVAKRLTSRYQPGKRSTDWIKVKSPTWREEHGPRRRERSYLEPSG